MQDEFHVDALAASLLGQERRLDAARQRTALRAGLDRARRRFKRLAGGHRRFALVVLQQRHKIGRRRNLRTLDVLRRSEDADRAVARLQIKRGDALHV